MLRGSERKEALEGLALATKGYEKQAGDTQKEITSLYLLREKCSKELIIRVESYVNLLANTPKEFDKSWGILKAEITTFDNVVKKLEDEYKSSHIGKGTATAGVVAGAGVAAFAPTAALAVATTFGAASTGTAIATLSGAAATNAALAWLGGGALAAGGGGMAAGNALLAMAGPIGWGIGAVGIVGGTLLARSKNGKIIEEAHEEDRRLRSKTTELRVIERSVQAMFALTSEHYSGTEHIIHELETDAPTDYCQFSHHQKEQLGALINHINALSKLINKKIE